LSHYIIRYRGWGTAQATPSPLDLTHLLISIHRVAGKVRELELTFGFPFYSYMTIQQSGWTKAHPYSGGLLPYGGGHDVGSEASSIYSHRHESDNPAKRMDQSPSVRSGLIRTVGACSHRQSTDV